MADLSGFEKGQEVPPGTYRVDIYLNNGFMTTRDVTFQADAQGHGLSPCLTHAASWRAWVWIPVGCRAWRRWTARPACR
ncbi:FimD/PapC N-terminal domain-containing protein [Klebsiella pneumoniae]